ncbi:uncharacterized protein TNCV_4257681 [Trichonephila clavipes]|nr:uncharacterized protein TNCV_4257681 [Trichonephila clavipes]
MTGTLPPLLDSVVGGGTPGRSCFGTLDPMLLCPGKGLVLPKLNIDQISTITRFSLISLPNNEMSSKSPFAIQKALVGIAKTFLDSPVTICPHKTLNCCRGVISEPDLLTTTDAEILNGSSGQGVIQVRRITIKRDALIIPTKHILTFNSTKLPSTIKAGYLNCGIRPYIPNPLRCFKCQRFGHSQTSCRGQLTCSRCASVGHSSTDCSLEPKCIDSSESHQEREAQKLILPQISQTYAQATKSSTTTTATQTDESITKIVCPPLKLLQHLTSVPKPTMHFKIPTVTKSSTSTEAQLLPSASSAAATSSESQPPVPYVLLLLPLHLIV